MVVVLLWSFVATVSCRSCIGSGQRSEGDTPEYRRSAVRPIVFVFAFVLASHTHTHLLVHLVEARVVEILRVLHGVEGGAGNRVFVE
jgi:plasmid stabilization system protein ParE